MEAILHQCKLGSLGLREPAKSLGPKNQLGSQELANARVDWSTGFAVVHVKPSVMGATCGHWNQLVLG